MLRLVWLLVRAPVRVTTTVCARPRRKRLRPVRGAVRFVTVAVAAPFTTVERSNAAPGEPMAWLGAR